jgi:hypothetical protein
MSTTHGWRKVGANKVPLPPYESYPHPIIPEKAVSDRTPRCLGCPYPRHGLSCHSKDSESCLRADMQELEAKWLAKQEAVRKSNSQT